MPSTSAGLLMYRLRAGQIEVLLVHPGGPFFRNRDEGAWTIPKGEVNADEDTLAAACREFHEETGLQPASPFVALGEIRQKSGKHVHAWAFAGECDPAACRSNSCTVEWPRGSGRQLTFPEVDRAEFFSLARARQKLNPAQVPFLDRLAAALASAP
jgi:predicted NUDIX family NTP pyrophosphohydrolase